MKNLFSAIVFVIIFLFLELFGSSVSAAGSNVFLTNQDGTQTTQFRVNDDIYIEGVCLPATQDIVKVYITLHKTWQSNDKLSDVSAGIETFNGNADGKILRTLIWKHPLNEGIYDVVIDTNNDQMLQAYEQQCIISGFSVGNAAPLPPSPTPPPPASPPPASEPPPAPSASSKASKSFSLDEQIMLTGLSNVRESPGGAIIGTQDEGAFGVVIGGPKQASLGGKYFWFWNISFDDGTEGWVSESTLKTAPVEETPAAPAKESVTTSPPNNTSANSTNNEALKQEPASDKMLAQVSGADKNSSSNSMISSIIIGAALFSGLVLGSFIIARALRPSSRPVRLASQRQRQSRRIDILPPEPPNA